MRIKNINPAKWYDIPGYGGKYQINYFADIRRVYKKGTHRLLKSYVKSGKGKCKRSVIGLNQKEKTVVSLMRDTFIGLIPEGYVIYHRNGILTDNILSNLEIITREELGRRTGTKSERRMQIVKIDSNGEIVDFYSSAREAGRKNFMSYQTILDRVNGKVKSLYAPDGYVYTFDTDKDVRKAIRRIELDNNEKCGVVFIEAPNVAFEF